MAVSKLQKQISLGVLLCRSTDIILDKKYVGSYLEVQSKWGLPFCLPAKARYHIWVKGFAKIRQKEDEQQLPECCDFQVKFIAHHQKHD